MSKMKKNVQIITTSHSLFLIIKGNESNPPIHLVANPVTGSAHNKIKYPTRRRKFPMYL